jgi:excisionase family DNA binding protein
MRRELPILAPLGRIFELDPPNIQQAMPIDSRTRLAAEHQPAAPRRRGRVSASARNFKSDLDLLTVGEVAEICRCHPKTVRIWIKNKELEAIRKGRSYRITRHALLKFLRKYRF